MALIPVNDIVCVLNIYKNINKIYMRIHTLQCDILLMICQYTNPHMYVNFSDHSETSSFMLIMLHV